MVTSLFRVLLWVAIFGTATSSIFLGLVLIAALRFVQRGKRQVSSAAAATGPHPPVSLLKPLHGAEPGLREYLESFFAIDYPEFEILFCARSSHDEGMKLAREVASHHPGAPVRFLACGDPPWPNARCYSVAAMAAEAANDLLVITDSDVLVRPRFLRDIVKPFESADVGASTCLYRGRAKGMGLWASMEGLGMSVEMTAGVVVAEMLEGMRFTLGPCMAVRRGALTEIGGFERLGHYYADDFMLGKLVAASGRRVALSSCVIDHCIVNNSFWSNFNHQWSWMKSTRMSRPWGHLGTGLTFGMPFGLLALVSGFMAGQPRLGIALLVWALVSRVLLCAVAGGMVVADPDALRYCWLYPFRDALGSIFWLASYASRKVGWREDRFVLQKDGQMRRIHSEMPQAGAS